MQAVREMRIVRVETLRIDKYLGSAMKELRILSKTNDCSGVSALFFNGVYN